MTSNSKQNPRYIFPIVAPILLAIGDLFIKFIAQGIVISSIFDFLIQASTVLLFGFFTIDIWGLTSTVTVHEDKDRAVLPMIWMTLLIFHFALYGIGTFFHQQFFELLQITGIAPMLPVLINLVLLLVGFLSLLYGRNAQWNRINI